jgi:hypothetical protein
VPVVTYRGEVEDLQGTRWDVPDSVLAAGQAASWIASQHRQQLAEEAAAAEAERRQAELLAARMEQQRLASEADVAAPVATRDELKAELAAELGDLSSNVIAAAAAIAGRGEAEASARAAWETRHEQLVATSETAIAEAQAQTAFAQASTQAALDGLAAEQQQRAEAFASLSDELRTAVLSQVGPQGDIGPEGLAGAGTVLSTEDPLEVDAESFGSRWYGRPLVAGDGVLVLRDSEILVRRWVGGAWASGPSITPKVEVADVKVSALDASTKVFPTVSTAVGGGSGGSGIVVPIAPSVITKNGTAPFVDTSRFQAGGFDSFTSGIIMLELTPTTGAFAGNRSSLVGAFQLLAGTPDPFRYTEFANLGNLFNGTTDVQFNGQLGPATAPGGLGISIPPGSKPATTLFITITSGEPSHTTFLLRGDVIFNQDPAGTAVAANALLPKQPAWQMV